MTHDELSELFLDYNMNNLLDLYENIKNDYEHMCIFRYSNSYDFLHILTDNISFVEYDDDDDSHSD
jgi:hypothetical protein